MSPRRALITGISGQDGTLLAERLRQGGMEVVGLARRPVAGALALDVTDHAGVERLVREFSPDECYHLAAYHRSSAAVDAPADEERAFLDTNLVATHALMRAIAAHRPGCRVFLAGSCHMFGDPDTSPQTEDTPLRPTSLYGITKTAAAQLGRLYREQHGLFCCTGILYNHESPLRGPSFVSTRIVRGAVAIKRGQAEELTVGDLDARVDWGYAGDYVGAMQAMLAADTAEDLIIASGELHTVRDFVELAFARVGLNWRRHVRQDASAHRPVSRALYHGEIARIRSRTGWAPSTSFEALVALLVDAALGR